MWFIDDPWPPVLILALLAVVFGLAWNSNRRGWYLLSALACVGLAFVVLVVEEMIITEAEEVEARVHELADLVSREDYEKVLDFLAGDAKDLRAEIGSHIQDVEIEDNLRITDVRVTYEPDTGKAVSHFRANGTVTWRKSLTQQVSTRWNLTWKKADGAWKIIQIDRLDPIKGEIIDTWSQP